MDHPHELSLAPAQDVAVQTLQGGPHPLGKCVPLSYGLGPLQLIQQFLVEGVEPLLEPVDWVEDGVAVTGGDKAPVGAAVLPGVEVVLDESRGGSTSSDGWINCGLGTRSSSMSSSSVPGTTVIGDWHSGAPAAAAAATFVLSWKYTKCEKNDVLYYTEIILHIKLHRTLS